MLFQKKKKFKKKRQKAPYKARHQIYKCTDSPAERCGDDLRKIASLYWSETVQITREFSGLLSFEFGCWFVFFLFFSPSFEIHLKTRSESARETCRVASTNRPTFHGSPAKREPGKRELPWTVLPRGLPDLTGGSPLWWQDNLISVPSNPYFLYGGCQQGCQLVPIVMVAFVMQTPAH